MIDIFVTRRKHHIVRSLPGCTVRQEGANGTVIETTVPADEDTPVFAHSGRWTVEGDENVTVTEVFKLAPWQKLALLGVLGGSTPAWLKALEAELTALLDGSQFELAWLAGEKKLVVHTDRVSDELLAAVKATAEAAMQESAVLVQYNHNIEVSWRDVNKYAACTNQADMLAVNAKYKNDLTSEGEWVYPLPSLTSGEKVFDSNAKIRIFHQSLPNMVGAFFMFASSAVESVKVSMPKVQAEAYFAFCENAKQLEYIEIYGLLSKNNIVGLCKDCIALKKAKIGQCNATHLKTTFYNCKSLSECDALFPRLSTSENPFYGTILNKESILRILNSFPTHSSGTHTFVVGIHIDHQNDEEVLAAIANAEAKGWTLTVQWNGKPTSTASTMAMGQLIYAKVGELERPDGTTEQYLDWGHYVTNPEGYETFRSLASAYRYFELPMPEDLTNN